MQAHALTRTRYLNSLNVIISHPIVYKEGLGYLSVCAIASRSSPPSHCVVVTVIQARSNFASTVESTDIPASKHYTIEVYRGTEVTFHTISVQKTG
jgi:hypothetical protein